MNPTHMTKRKRELLREYFLNASLIALLKTIGAETARTRDANGIPALAPARESGARRVRARVV
jgi:hypothetical protein